MKTAVTFIVLWLLGSHVNAQKIIEKTMDFSGRQAISLDIQIADSIVVQTWNKNEVTVRASVNINDNKDNDAYETSFDESGNTIKVHANFKKDYFKGKKNCCNESEIYWTVFMPEKTDLSVESINADITVKGKPGPVAAKSISGFIDLTYAENKSADLEFSTVSGTIYTNHDLISQTSGSGMPVHMRYQMNNGGEKVKLETISGDIFFRK